MAQDKRTDKIANTDHLDQGGGSPGTPSIPAERRELLRLGEVAKLCGVSTKTVNRWLATEGLPHVRKAGAGARPILFVRPGDLEAWIEEGLRDPRAAPPDGRVVHLQGRRLVSSDRHRRRWNKGT